MATYVIVANTTSQQSAVLTSTKVKVAATVSVFFAVGPNPTAYAGNCAIIPANTVRDINVGNGNVAAGTGNKIAFLQVSTGGNVSITEIGTVDFTKVST